MIPEGNISNEGRIIVNTVDCFSPLEFFKIYLTAKIITLIEFSVCIHVVIYKIAIT